MQTAIKPHHILAAAAFLASTLAFAGYRSQVGYDQLLQEFGSALPDGNNLTLLQVEAPDGSSAWATATTGELSRKTITFPYSTVAPTKFSAHANIVATNLIGSSCSLVPGAPSLLCAGSSAYRNTSLGAGSFEAPLAATWDIENHSYAGNAGAYNICSLQLIDYRINRDATTVVVALENGTGSLPPLFANSYNVIAVGVSSGAHSRGGTTFDGLGRLKPDLVAPASYTSYATPMVASAAGLLIAEAKRTSSLALAKDPRVIKALLMAGATKEEFPTWAATPTSPLDPVYGAGELNIANSYRMLRAGRQTAGSLRTSTGWDKAATSTSSVYFFQVPTGQTLTLSAVLTWHREQTSSNFFSFVGELPDLALRLRQSNASRTKGSILAESNSPLDNVEHLYRTALPAGYYALEVTGPTGIAYGLAWQGTGAGPTAPATPTTAVLPGVSTSTTTQVISGGTPAPAEHPALLLRAAGGLAGKAQALSTEFTISGRDRKLLLVRGLGPALGDTGTARPVLSLHQNGHRIAYNESWRGSEAKRIRQTTTSLAVDPLDERGCDAAFVVSLAPGSYRLTLCDKRGNAAQGRLEIFDASPASRSRLRVGNCGAVGELNLVLAPAALPTGELLLCATDAGHAAPLLTAFSGSTLLAENAGWSTAANAADLACALEPGGAMQLPAEDLSAILLPPATGSIALQVSGVEGSAAAPALFIADTLP